MPSDADHSPTDKVNQARRRLLKLAAYVPPAVISVIALDMAACQPSCNPSGCQPASCPPADCCPGGCPPVVPCGPDGGPCGPDTPCTPDCPAP